jgi:hypothetical protein
MQLKPRKKEDVTVVETREHKTLIRSDHMDRYICCECNTDEHVIRLLWEADDPNFVYFHYHLIPEPNIFVRIWKAVKYVFGFKSKYGMFGEMLVGRDGRDNIVEVLEKIQ